MAAVVYPVSCLPEVYLQCSAAVGFAAKQFCSTSTTVPAGIQPDCILIQKWSLQLAAELLSNLSVAEMHSLHAAGMFQQIHDQLNEYKLLARHG